MTALAPSARDPGASCGRSDYWRRSPASAGGLAGHKEWQYFYIAGEQVDLVVNFSIMDRLQRSGAAAATEEGRVALLARTADGGWSGDLELCDSAEVSLRGGAVGARFGESSLDFHDGGYHLHARAGTAPHVSARLVLQPTARPALVRSVPLGEGHPLHWLVVPRLAATGEVQVGTTRMTLRGAPAYHDHNWGRFAWGGDFAWEWAVAIGSAMNPWTIIYYRISDRGRHRVSAQGVLLWRDGSHCRTFRDGELDVRSIGLRRLGRCLRVPRIMSLAIPGTASDIPSRLEIEAACGADAVRLDIAPEDCAQIGVPGEQDLGLTLISECRARVRLRGVIRGETVCVDAPAMVEFNRAA